MLHFHSLYTWLWATHRSIHFIPPFSNPLLLRYQVMPRFLLKHCHGMLTQPLITMPDLRAFPWITRTVALSLPKALAAWAAAGSAASACTPWMGQLQLHSRSFQGKLNCFALQIGLRKTKDITFSFFLFFFPSFSFPHPSCLYAVQNSTVGVPQLNGSGY